MVNNVNQHEGLRPPGELLVYQGHGTGDPIDLRLKGETVRLNQKLRAELYDVGVSTINEHILNIYDDEELRPEATIPKFWIVQTEGTRQVNQVVKTSKLDLLIKANLKELRYGE